MGLSSHNPNRSNGGDEKLTMVFANKRTGIVHHKYCPFHPSTNNMLIYEELYQALAEGYEECSYCYGCGEYWDRGKECYQCEVDCNVWCNDCPKLIWDEDHTKTYCKLKGQDMEKNN